MGVLATIGFVVLGISFLVFIAFFGRLPLFRQTPIAFLHRLLCVHLPNGLLAIDQKLTSGRVSGYSSRFFNYIMYDRHPTVLIFFLLLLAVGEYLYLPAAWPKLSIFHKVAGSISIAAPYIFLYLSAASDPGSINADNHVREMARYPYDFTLFHPGAACSTCILLKPARSKHCSICKRCVARADHHCIFINNCVGAGNHHWFLLLLISTGVLTLYGGILGLSILTDTMKTRFPQWTWFAWRGGGAAGEGLTLDQWLAIWSWGLSGSAAMGSVTLLAVLTSPMVWGLTVYHIWLVWCGTTTNESMKWSDWQLEMDDGCAFKRRLPPGRAKALHWEPAWTRWPAEAEQIVVRTQDGSPPNPDLAIAGEGGWERVYKLRDVENLYDIGFWDNLLDVFRPGYMFRDDRTPLATDRARNRMKRRKRSRRGT